MHRAQVIYAPVFVLAGIALWLVVYESGVHATIAGVVLGLLTPARPTQTALEADEVVDLLENRDDLRADEVRATARLDQRIGVGLRPADRRPAPVDELRHRAGVRPGQRRHPAVRATPSPIRPTCSSASRSRSSSANSSGSPRSAGSPSASGSARLPAGAGWRHIVGVGAVAGIGFTVSLFITGLAFDTDTLQDDAKIGILVASIIAAIIGATIFVLADRRAPR